MSLKAAREAAPEHIPYYSRVANSSAKTSLRKANNTVDQRVVTRR